MAPVIFEKYNEIIFYEPTEHFYPVLMANKYSKYLLKEQARTDKPN